MQTVQTCVSSWWKNRFKELCRNWGAHLRNTNHFTITKLVTYSWFSQFPCSFPGFECSFPSSKAACAYPNCKLPPVYMRTKIYGTCSISKWMTTLVNTNSPMNVWTSWAWMPHNTQKNLWIFKRFLWIEQRISGWPRAENLTYLNVAWTVTEIFPCLSCVVLYVAAVHLIMNQ